MLGRKVTSLKNGTGQNHGKGVKRDILIWISGRRNIRKFTGAFNLKMKLI